MDGSHVIYSDTNDSKEAARQADVYQKAMKSIQAKKRRDEARGYAVMASMTSMQGVHQGKFMHAVRLFIIAFAMIMPVAAFWAIAL